MVCMENKIIAKLSSPRRILHCQDKINKNVHGVKEGCGRMATQKGVCVCVCVCVFCV